MLEDCTKVAAAVEVDSEILRKNDQTFIANSTSEGQDTDIKVLPRFLVYATGGL